MFGSFTVHAGDFKQGKEHQCLQGKLTMKNPKKFFRETIPLTEIMELEIASEENVKRIGGAFGWGIAGTLLLGPIGTVAGLLLGGKGKDVTFVCKLKDGRKFLATAPHSVYMQMSAVLFK